MATFALEHKQSKEECKFRGKDMKTQIGSTFRIRHAVIFMLFMSTTVGYATRVSMSLAIVAMTTENDYGYQVFDWDDAVQDTILSSFFWGYIVFQVPAGLLAGRYGGKYLAFVSLLSSGIINLFVPLAAYYGDWYAVCACRILMGLGQGLLYPSIHGLLSHWAPITERSRMGSIVYAGSQLGTIVEMMTAGLLSASRWGWPSVYYVAGLICLVWSAVWLIIGASKPSESRWISKEERKYIEMNTGPTEVDSSKKMSTPWKGIWTSLSFWAILLANCGQCLGFWTLLTEIPIYMNRVLGVDIKSNGLLSALPYTAMYILSFIFSWSAELLVNRNIITLRAARKIFNTIGFWGSAAALLILSYLPPGHLNIAVLALTITVGLNGAHYVGYLITHIDISPNFASVLMGITNCFGNIFSIIAPLSASLFVRDKSSASDWRNLFFISIAFYFLSNLFFILFMSGKIEDWNEPQPTGKSLEDGINEKDDQSTRKKSIEEKS